MVNKHINPMLEYLEGRYSSVVGNSNLRIVYFNRTKDNKEIVRWENGQYVIR